MIKKLIEMFKNETDEAFYAKLEQDSAARRNRNEQRMNEIKVAMGEKWIMHPSHTKGRLDEPRPV